MKSAPAALTQSGLVHHLRVRQIGVGHRDLIDVVLLDEFGELLLRLDGYTLGITLPAQLGRVGPPVNIGNLGGREGDYVVTRVVAPERVEVVEVPAGGTDDDNLDPFL